MDIIYFFQPRTLVYSRKQSKCNFGLFLVTFWIKNSERRSAIVTKLMIVVICTLHSILFKSNLAQPLVQFPFPLTVRLKKVQLLQKSLPRLSLGRGPLGSPESQTSETKKSCWQRADFFHFLCFRPNWLVLCRWKLIRFHSGIQICITPDLFDTRNRLPLKF